MSGCITAGPKSVARAMGAASLREIVPMFLYTFYFRSAESVRRERHCFLRKRTVTSERSR